MTSSGVWSFNPTADELITEAWERCGKAGDVLNGVVARSARRSLMLMLIDWQNIGLNLWQVEKIDLTLTAGVDAVTTVANTSDVLEVVLSTGYGLGSDDLLLSSISRDEWVASPNRIQRARPTCYWVERINPLPILHFYPLPDQDYTGSYWRIRLPQDVGGLVNTLDVPILWAEALAAGLAAKLSVKFAPDRAAGLKMEAQEAYSKAARENRERVPLTLAPRLSRR